MAKAAGLSHSTIGRIWRTFRLQPHRTESFKLSPDPQLVDKIRDVVGRISDPPTNAVVFSIDEKSRFKLSNGRNRSCRWISASPSGGRTTTSGTGRSISSRRSTSPRARSSPDAKLSIGHRTWSRFCARLRRASNRRSNPCRAGQPLGTQGAAVQRWLVRHPRVQFHFTPTYASWLNLVERFFGLLTEKALKRGSHTSMQLRAAILGTSMRTTNGTRRSNGSRPLMDPRWRFGLRVQQVHGQ